MNGGHAHGSLLDHVLLHLCLSLPVVSQDQPPGKALEVLPDIFSLPWGLAGLGTASGPNIV